MTNVYAWPPVGLTGWEITKSMPISRSVGIIDGRPRTSSAQRVRRLATAIVSGIGLDAAGAGYIEVLKELMAGGEHLTRMNTAAPIWHLARSELKVSILDWTDSGSEMLWSDSGAALDWLDGGHPGTPTTDDGWPAITVTGLPPDQIVARPSERIVVYIGDSQTAPLEYARVLAVARSNASGVATIRLMTAISAAGLVGIGQTESIVFEALDMPRAVQPVAQNWVYTWNFREVFLDEYTAWTELNPWG